MKAMAAYGDMQGTLNVRSTMIAIGWQFSLFYVFSVASRDEQFMAEL